MYDMTLHAMIIAHQPKEPNSPERFSVREIEFLDSIRKKNEYKVNRDRYCKIHKAVTRQDYGTCSYCAWKYYCNHSVGKVR